jgi:four helix bundle protein
MELQSNQNFTELEVWQKARALKKENRTVSKGLPVEEKYRLADQLIRSVRSINANIAEGHGRFTYKDQLHFCIQARGSLCETLNHLIDAFDCAYITDEQLVQYKNKIDEIGRLLNGYITYLRKKLKE